MTIVIPARSTVALLVPAFMSISQLLLQEEREARW
jgi:hypothetical protein